MVISDALYIKVFLMVGSVSGVRKGNYKTPLHISFL